LRLFYYWTLPRARVGHSDWIRHLCGIQLTDESAAMKSITKQQAHEFKERWEFVNDFIAEQIRNTPGEVKLQQLSAMFMIGESRSPAFLAEEQEVRNRWLLLKQKTNV
jgi:hypothetical protein